MIKLTYPIATERTQAWTERLEKLLIDFTSEEAMGLLEPAIHDNGTRYGGSEAVEKFIAQLEADIADWRTPRCGV